MWARKLLKLSAWHQALTILVLVCIYLEFHMRDKWTSMLQKLLLLLWIFHLLQPNLIITKYVWHLDKHTFALTYYLHFIFPFNLPSQPLLIIYALAPYITSFPFSNCFHLSVAGPCCIFTCPKLRQPPRLCSDRNSCPDPLQEERVFPNQVTPQTVLLTENTSIACSACVMVENKPTLLSTMCQTLYFYI